MRTSAAILALLLGWAAVAEAADDAPESAWGRTVSEVELLGSRHSSVSAEALPIARGEPLRRDEVRRTLEILHASGRFSRVSARALPARAGSVRVVFHVEPVRRILRVSFVGASQLDENLLRRAADLPSGVEFTPDRVQRAAEQVAHAYYRAGYRETFVRWDATRLGDEISVTFSLAEGLPIGLEKLSFEGDTGLDPAELRALVGIRAGAPISLDLMERGSLDVQRRLRQRGFYRARTGRPRVDSADPEARNAIVTVPVEAGPLFRMVVRGNRTFDQDFLLERLGYSGEEYLDEPLLRELTLRLRGFYELAGFPFADVEVRESVRAVPREHRPVSTEPPDWQGRTSPVPPTAPPAASEERLLTFLVREGEPLRVVERSFEGAEYFSTQELDLRVTAVLESAVPAALAKRIEAARLRASRAGRPPPSGAVPHRIKAEEVFAERPYKVAAGLLADLYKAEGFLDAKVGPARLERLGDHHGRVVVPVREGPRTTVKEVHLEGVVSLPFERVREVLTIRRGDPLSFFAIEESRTAIVQLYQAAGHPYVQVEDEEDLPPAGTSGGARVLFRVREGPATRVSSVEIRGLGRTDPQLVRQSLALLEGDLLTPQGRQETARNLFRTGLFSSVLVEPADPDVPATEKPLVVEVRERPYSTTEVRAGFSLADGPRLSGQLTRANLGGRNRTFSASAKVNWPIVRYHLELPEACLTCELPDDPIERRVNLSLVTPYYRGPGEPQLDLRVDGVHEHLLRPAYQLTKFAALGSLDGFFRRQLGRFELSALLQGELEQATFAHRITELRQVFVTLADRRALLLPEGSILLASLRPSITLDGRDDKLNPTSGLIGSVMLDFSKSILAHEPAPERTPFDIALIRALFSVSGYVPVYRPQRVVFAVSGRLGAIAKTDHSQVIGTKRFFLGGTQSLRGFNEDLLVPQDVRMQLRDAVNRCNSLISSTACDEQVRRVSQGVFPISQGGEFLVAGRAELRFGLTSSLDGGLFVDAGNLWLDPRTVDLASLRYAGGAGLRFALPIGPAAFDVGVNPDPDLLVGEPSVRLHLSIGLF